MSGTKRAVAFAAMLCGMLVASAGCGPPGPQTEQGALRTLGSNTRVGQIKLRNVYVVAPQDSQYQPGQRARVRLTLLNEGSRRDALIKVTSEVASATSLHWDRSCDGEAERVDRIVITPYGLVPQNPLASGSAPASRDTPRREVLHQPYYVQITVNDTIRRGTTVPITFTFERAGTATVEVLVQSSHPADERAKLACLTSR